MTELDKNFQAWSSAWEPLIGDEANWKLFQKNQYFAK